MAQSAETAAQRADEHYLDHEPVQCEGCGAFGSSTDRFCACCGSQLQRICPSCKADIVQPVAFFCTQCGTRIQEQL